MMRVGKHVLDRSPGVLAFDHAKSEWGQWLDDGRTPRYDEARIGIESLLITVYGQDLRQAAFATHQAFESVIDQARLEKEI